MMLCRRPFEDAGNDDDATAKEEGPTGDKARKRKSTSKGAAAKADREREPAMARAEQLLAAAEASAGGDMAVPGHDAPEIL